MKRGKVYFRPELLRDRLCADDKNGTVVFAATGFRSERAGRVLVEVQRIRKVFGPFWTAMYPAFLDYDENFVPQDEEPAK